MESPNVIFLEYLYQLKRAAEYKGTLPTFRVGTQILGQTIHIFQKIFFLNIKRT